MREWSANPGNDLSEPLEELEKSRHGEKCCLLVSAIIRLIYFEISKEVFSVQGAWHTQNTQPTIVHDQSIIANYRGASDYPAHVDALGSSRFL